MKLGYYPTTTHTWDEYYTGTNSWGYKDMIWHLPKYCTTTTSPVSITTTTSGEIKIKQATEKDIEDIKNHTTTIDEAIKLLKEKDMLKITHVDIEKEKKIIVDKTKRDDNGNYVVHKEYIPVATIVTFENGSKQTAYCDKDDEFNLEIGISICVTRELMKRLYGIDETTSPYNKVIRNGLNVYKKEQKRLKKIAEKVEKDIKIDKNKKAKEQRRRIKRAEKKKEREIEIMAEAIRRANASKIADSVMIDDRK